MQQCQVALRHLYQFFTICDQVLSCLLEAQLSLDPLLNSVSNHMLEQQMSTHVGEISYSATAIQQQPLSNSYSATATQPCSSSHSATATQQQLLSNSRSATAPQQQLELAAVICVVAAAAAVPKGPDSHKSNTLLSGCC